MTLYQDMPTVTIHMTGCRQEGGWLVVSTNPVGPTSEFNLRLNAVIAYRLYNGNVLHVFTTGQTFALAIVGQLRADAADRVMKAAAGILGNATTEEAA